MSAPVTPPPAPPEGWISAVKGMTLTNAAVILLLVTAGIPAYTIWRLLSDEALLDRFLSAYQILPTNTACRLIKARQRGEDYTWAVTTGFAFEGQSRWTIGVITSRQPSEEEQATNCLLLQTIIDAMHGMGPPPNIIWQQRDIQGREGEKGER
jgi:hypothetical protein